MDQPFESDVMADLVEEAPMSFTSDGFDEYEGMEADDFDRADSADALDESVEASFSLNQDTFGDHLEGDLWDDSGDLGDGDLGDGDLEAQFGDSFKSHRTHQRESNRPRHEQGQRRRRMDRGGEQGDDRRQLPRRRPPGHRGPWPPRENAFSDEFLDDGMDAFSEDMDDFEMNYGDSFATDSYDELAEGESVNAMDAMESAIADALEAEDSDEFFRRIARGVRQAANIARQVGRGVGQVARVVGPVASLIPLPQAQAIGAIANIAGRLLADGADEFEALDEMLTFAEAEDAIDAAAPIIAGLTIRTIMPRASQLNRTSRRQLVQSVRQSTQTLARRQGAPAIRAIPRVVGAVQRTAQRRRIPAQQLPQAIRRATATVARNPRLVSRLARATQQASTVTRRYSTRSRPGIPQRLVIRGPVEITIRSR